MFLVTRLLLWHDFFHTHTHTHTHTQLAASKAKQADKARPQKERDEATAKIDRLTKTEWLCDYMVKAEVGNP